jgi:hypothetical protein
MNCPKVSSAESPPYPGRNKRPPESKSDSLERFPGSGVTHLPAAG